MSQGALEPRALELYCGVGGFAAAAAGRLRVTAAVDVSRLALGVYRHNFAHRTVAAHLDSLDPGRLAAFGADVWWASPPCQPFTRRGRRRDLDDPRAVTFLALLRHLEAVRPRAFALENVAGFEGSRAHQRLRDVLDDAGYGHVRELLLCPSGLGVPSRRPRFYLLACRRPLRPPAEPGGARRPLRAYLDADPEPGLEVEPELLERYRGALHVVDAGDPEAVTTCFTSAYGRSPVRSGSYLRMDDGRIRRFSPREALRLLGFPPSYTLPPDLTRRQAWRLLGNSLSLDAVRFLLAALPVDLADTSAAMG